MKNSILIILLIVSYASIGQHVNFENFNENTGLPSTQVYDIYQDDNGYLWFASDRGIARYDGYNFEVFGIKEGISGNTVFKFYPQKNGDVWCSTFNNRLFYFNISDYKFHAYQYNDSLVKYAVDAVINDLHVKDDGGIFLSYVIPFGYLNIDKVGNLQKKSISNVDQIYYAVLEKTKNNQLYKYCLNTNKELTPLTSEGSILSSQRIKGSSFKAIQIGGLNILCDKKEFFIKSGNRLIKSINNGYRPVNIGRFDNSHFWVGYRDGGVKIFDLQGNVTRSYLDDESVTFLLTDHEGGLWISTLSSGVFHCKNPEVLLHDIGDEKYVYNLARDSNQNLWVSLYDGRTYLRQNLEFKLQHTSSVRYPISIDYFEGSKSHIALVDNILFINNEFSYNFTDSNSPKIVSDAKVLFNYINSWFLLDKNKVNLYASKQRIKDIEFADNGFYLATNRGLFFYDSLTKQETALIDPMLKFRIEDIQKVGEKYYFATLGSGVVIKKNNRTTSILKKDGLYSDQINKLYIENDSTLWVCSNMGLNRIEFHQNRTFTILGLSKSDGLIYNNISDVEVIHDTVWVGTRAGLCSFPKSLLDAKMKQRKVDFYLKYLSFEVNNERVSTSTLSELSYDQNKLTFHFKAISFNNNSDLVYRYRIDELESEWNYTSEQSCTYPSIPFGDYNIDVQVSADGKFWSPKISQGFSLFPPFYRMWWFIVLVLMSISGAIYLFFKLRVLVYNRDVTRELIRLLIQKLKRKEHFVLFREMGKDVKIKSSDILYVKSSNNYIEIFTSEKTHIVRFKIGEFLALTPDPLEYLRVHRSYIIRIDKVNSKSVKNVQIRDVDIPIGRSYLDQLDKIHF